MPLCGIVGTDMAVVNTCAHDARCHDSVRPRRALMLYVRMVTPLSLPTINEVALTRVQPICL